MSQGSQKPAESTFFLALAVIRKVTAEGAVQTGQRLFHPKGALSVSHFERPCRERDWDLIMDAACRECRLPGRYLSMGPQNKLETKYVSNSDFVTMVYPIELNGPIADLFRAMNEFVNTVNYTPGDVLDGLSGLTKAIGVFDDPLTAAFTALSAKVRCLNIPPLVPIGKSELDMYEEAHPPVAASDQSKTS